MPATPAKLPAEKPAHKPTHSNCKGVIGASDTHQTGGAYEENNDGTAEVRLGGKSPLTPVIRTWGSAGLGGVWAEENTREAIFDAMVRKETFGTSGPRMKVRFFGGWSLTKELLARQDWLKAAYEQGVPMGGDLPPAPSGKTPCPPEKSQGMLIWGGLSVW